MRAKHLSGGGGVNVIQGCKKNKDRAKSVRNKTEGA